jgi:hypothetical protein
MSYSSFGRKPTVARKLAVILAVFGMLFGSPLSLLADDSAITTGDATAVTSGQTEANTNIENAGGDASGSPAASDASSGTDVTQASDDDDDDADDTQTAVSEDDNDGDDEIVLDASNTASIHTTASTTAETGFNTASTGSASSTDPEVANTTDTATDAIAASSTETALVGSSTASTTGNASIDTGNATGVANIVNLANTNILDSNGSVNFISNLFNPVETIDLRGFGTGTSTCSLSSCDDNDTEIAVAATNTADIINDIVVRAATGENTASSTGGNALITTGDAYAAANVLNVANTNIIDSNYLIMLFNNFGSWGGDIVLPSGDAFASLFGGGAYSLDANNDATIGNNVNATADTGGNSASSTGTSTEGIASVTTGTAVSGTNVLNHVNQNIFGNGSFMMVLKVHGDWSGELFNLPEGLSWKQTPDGIVLWSSSAPIGDDDDDDGEADLDGDGDDDEVEIATANMATIVNNVDALAITGGNIATADGDATIETGDATAVANVVNIANTNVVGKNWVLAIVNIFGDWSGNIAFGRPDLWVAGRAETESNPAGPGSKITYRITVANRGDAPANDVKLENIFDRTKVSFGQDIAASIPGGLSWAIGTVAPGTSKEIVYAAVVASDLPQGDTQLTNALAVRARESDNNTADNTDVLTVLARRAAASSGGSGSGGGGSSSGTTGGSSSSSNTSGSGGSGGSSGPELTPDAFLTVTKTNSATGPIKPGDKVDYKIVVKNTGGKAYGAVLHDVLKDENGAVVTRDSWDLGEIFAGEEIVITYTVEFRRDSRPGAYTNYAEVDAYDRYPVKASAYADDADSATVSSMVQVEGGRDPRLGEATSTETSFLGTIFNGTGGGDDSEEGVIRDAVNRRNARIAGATVSKTGAGRIGGAAGDEDAALAVMTSGMSKDVSFLPTSEFAGSNQFAAAAVAGTALNMKIAAVTLALLVAAYAVIRRLFGMPVGY